MKKNSLFLASILFVIGIFCNQPTKQYIKHPGVITPDFNSDSAYKFIENQVNFGPRVPNSIAHSKCAEYLVNKMKNYKAEVIIQNIKLKAFDGTILDARNIIAQYNLSAQNRILLCAHWDTRPYADEDTANMNIPIAGANDGASGVGVLLEIARVLSNKSPKIGIDIIFFDAEDYGEPSWNTQNKNESWCLGSQYWSANKHKKNYKANFGILLDMIGSKGAKFTKEDNSRHFASIYVKYVWEVAQILGYDNYFIDKKTRPIIDDHFFVNTIAKIPCLVIVDYNDSTETNYGAYWHTHQDNMNIIDKNTLKAVGQTLLEIIFAEKE